MNPNTLPKVSSIKNFILGKKSTLWWDWVQFYLNLLGRLPKDIDDQGAHHARQLEHRLILQDLFVKKDETLALSQ